MSRKRCCTAAVSITKATDSDFKIFGFKVLSGHYKSTYSDAFCSSTMTRAACCYWTLACVGLK